MDMLKPELTYEGRPCKHCTGTTRYSSNNHCRVCHSRSDRDKYGARRAEQDARRRLKTYCPMAQMDVEAIVELYREAAFLSITTGVPHHVDHVVPLNHPLVSGLHVSWNLEVIPARQNLEKSNCIDLDSMSWTSPDCLPRLGIEDLINSVAHTLGDDSVGSHDLRDNRLDSFYRMH